MKEKATVLTSGTKSRAGRLQGDELPSLRTSQGS